MLEHDCGLLFWATVVRVLGLVRRQ